MGAGRSVLRACFNRTQAVCRPVCLSATQSSCLGGKGQDGEQSAGYSLPSQADTPRRRERQGGLGDSSEALPESSVGFLLLLLPELLNRPEPGC